jgi:hypothetical protein
MVVGTVPVIARFYQQYRYSQEAEMRRLRHRTAEEDKRRRSGAAGDYTTVGQGDGWYGHQGGPTDRDRDRLRQHGSATNEERPPFDSERESGGNGPDWYEQDRETADYAYGSYGRREPGHARSDPYPLAPHGQEH